MARGAGGAINEPSQTRNGLGSGCASLRDRYRAGGAMGLRLALLAAMLAASREWGRGCPVGPGSPQCCPGLQPSRAGREWSLPASWWGCSGVVVVPDKGSLGRAGGSSAGLFSPNAESGFWGFGDFTCSGYPPPRWHGGPGFCRCAKHVKGHNMGGCVWGAAHGGTGALWSLLKWTLTVWQPAACGWVPQAPFLFLMQVGLGWLNWGSLSRSHRTVLTFLGCSRAGVQHWCVHIHLFFSMEVSRKSRAGIPLHASLRFVKVPLPHTQLQLWLPGTTVAAFICDYN